MENSEFMTWFRQLVLEASQREVFIDTEDPESYRDYFDQGLTPDQAIDEDINDDDFDWDD